MSVKSRSFYVNEWQIDPDTLRIASGEKALRLGPRVMQVLVYLADRPDEVVPRQELEEHVWARMIVGYDSLTKTITKLRKAFGDSSSEPRFIETIPKTGYRMIASVRALDHDPPVSTRLTAEERATPVQDARSLWWLAAAAVLVAVVSAVFWWQSRPASGLALPEAPSIAVMPFINTGNDPRQNYFIDGITEDLITDLSNVPGLFVIARNSSFSYKGKSVDVKQVAGELGVRFILQGSYLALADALSYSDRPDSAIDAARKGMRLDPNFSAPYLLVIGRVQFDMGRYAEAVGSLERAVAVNPHERDARVVLLAARGHLGASEQAAQGLAALNQEHEAHGLRPFTMDWLTNRWPYRDRSDRQHLLAGLEKAGVPRW